MLVMNAVTGQWESPISKTMEEFVIKSEDEMTALYDNGADEDGRLGFASRMIGVGKPRHRSLVRFGIFVSENEVPTREELRNAHLALEADCEVGR
jgi:hypothetical protein